MRLRGALAAGMAVMVTGCASFDGMPRPVLTEATVDSMIVNYRPDDVVARMGQIAPGDKAGRNTFRNRVVMAYLTAIDARYDTFRRELSRSGKGGHLAADVVTLGLTGLGSMLAGAAQELSAAATAVAGARSSFDKEVLIDKTLPVLMSLMDSQRLKVRADIMSGLSRDEGEYTIEEAFSDLMRYQTAGTIDTAVQQAAEGAAQEAEEADYNYSQAIELCTVDTATALAQRTLNTELEAIGKATFGTNAANAALAQKQLQDAAAVAGTPALAPATTEAAALAQLAPIRDLVETFCDVASVNAFATKLKTAGVPVT